MVRRLPGAALALSAACVLALLLLLVGCAGSESAAPAQDEASAGVQPGADTTVDSNNLAESDLQTYVITRVDGAPEWDAIPQVDLTEQWIDVAGISAHAQLAYDDETLYVHMWAEEPDVRATYTKDDVLPRTYEDSCLEFFLAPVADDERYMNFEFNANCAVCNQIGVEKAGRVNLVPVDDLYNATAELTDDGWEITYEVPFEYLRTLYPGFEPESGMQIRGNFYKCGNLTAQKHYLSWSPIESDSPNFHVPENFGVLIFE